MGIHCHANDDEDFAICGFEDKPVFGYGDLSMMNQLYSDNREDCCSRYGHW